MPPGSRHPFGDSTCGQLGCARGRLERSRGERLDDWTRTVTGHRPAHLAFVACLPKSAAAEPASMMAYSYVMSSPSAVELCQAHLCPFQAHRPAGVDDGETGEDTAEGQRDDAQRRRIADADRQPDAGHQQPQRQRPVDRSIARAVSDQRPKDAQGEDGGKGVSNPRRSGEQEAGKRACHCADPDARPAMKPLGVPLSLASWSLLATTICRVSSELPRHGNQPTHEQSFMLTTAAA